MTGAQSDRAALVQALDLGREAADCHQLGHPEEAYQRVRSLCLVLSKRIEEAPHG